ncbi:MAG: response regulator [Phototrophicaceae bacterium]|jgi:CheY-like chemotaxis protein
MTPQPIILYVEDDPQSREIMRFLCEVVLGLAHVNIFENSANFLERLTALDPKPNIILLDIHVPPYDGFEMLAMLRQLPAFQDTPTVALTASVMNEEVEKLRNAGFNGIIAKPVDTDQFATVIQRILDGQTHWTVIE